MFIMKNLLVTHAGLFWILMQFSVQYLCCFHFINSCNISNLIFEIYHLTNISASPFHSVISFFSRSLSRTQVWMCGGTLLIVTCSHVGHVFRKATPYTFPGGTGRIINRNNARLAEVWMDTWGLFYYKVNPGSATKLTRMHLSSFSVCFHLYNLLFVCSWKRCPDWQCVWQQINDCHLIGWCFLMFRWLFHHIWLAPVCRDLLIGSHQ